MLGIDPIRGIRETVRLIRQVQGKPAANLDEIAIVGKAHGRRNKNHKRYDSGREQECDPVEAIHSKIKAYYVNAR